MPRTTPDKKPVCFVISPIGEDGSAVRKRANQFLNHIVKAVLEPAYEVIRADEDQPGIIDHKIFERLESAELVVADLSHHNPNVFYELAVRHVLRKPFVQMIAKGDKLPFDVGRQTTIFFDINDLDSVEQARRALSSYARKVTAPEFEVETPLTVAHDLVAAKASADPIAKQLAHISETLESQGRRLSQIESNTKPVSFTYSAGSDPLWVPDPSAPLGISVLPLSQATDEAEVGPQKNKRRFRVSCGQGKAA